MNWPAITAISTAIIAAFIVILIIGVLFLVARLIVLSRVVRGFVESLERDTRPALETAKLLISESQRVAVKLTGEVKDITDTSQDLRQRLIGAVDRIEERLVDLDTLVDVVQEEVEETVLDVGAALRTTRRGGALVGSVRRLLFGKTRKRRRRRRR